MIRKLIYTHILLQILDGLLTYFGMLRFGVEYEGNPLINFTMETIGVAPALILYKGIGVCMMLYLLYYEEFFNCKQMNIMLAFLNFLYIVLAIIPWIFVHTYPSILFLTKGI
jgi:hypothetical protein